MPLPTMTDMMRETFGEDIADNDDDDDDDYNDDDDSSIDEGNMNSQSDDLDITITEAIHRGYRHARGLTSPRGK